MLLRDICQRKAVSVFLIIIFFSILNLIFFFNVYLTVSFVGHMYIIVDIVVCFSLLENANIHFFNEFSFYIIHY